MDGRPRKVKSSWRFYSEMDNVPDSVSKLHPRTFLKQVRSPTPAVILLMSNESLASLGKERKSHLKDRTVL